MTDEEIAGLLADAEQTLHYRHEDEGLHEFSQDSAIEALIAVCRAQQGQIEALRRDLERVRIVR